MKFECDIGVREAHAGELLVFNPLEVHRGWIDRDNPFVRYVFVVTILSTFCIGMMLPDNRVIEELVQLRARLDEHITDRGLAGRIGERLCDISDLYKQASSCESDELGIGLMAHGHAAIALGMLISGGRVTETSNFTESDFVIHVRNFVEQNYLHEITKEDILREFSYSHSHFCRLFKQRFETSFSSYLRDYRLAKAFEELSRSDVGRRSISEIALGVGFTDYCYFTHSFKKHYGMTPREFINSQSLRRRDR